MIFSPSTFIGFLPAARLACVILTCCTLLCPLTSRADDLAELTAKAEKGDAKSQYELARKYDQGQDVSKDAAKALEWYTKAANQGHANAEVSLGSIYAHGFGVPADFPASIVWYRRAAAKGNTTAQHNLGLDYAHAHGVTLDYAQAARWFRLAADQGHARAQYNLGELYEEGRGVEQSDTEAYVLYNLAAAHENQEHIFGKTKADEVLMKRARVEQKLTPEQIATAKIRVADAQAFYVFHPRKFGVTDLGTSRGWYVFHKWNPETWEAEIGRDPLDGHTWKVRVLPWVSAYRRGVYGQRPDALLPGEKVNIFFSPTPTERRGVMVSFQDEISQMKGHGHFWQVTSVAPDVPGDPAFKTFNARIMAGDKPLDAAGREVTFRLGADCVRWKDGAKVAATLPEVDEKLYMTWVYRNDKPTVALMLDMASFEPLKKIEEERIDKLVAAEGLGGQIEVIEDNKVYFMVYSNHWKQGQSIKPGDTVRLTATGPGYHPVGEQVEGKVLAAKNRGTYGSGTNDVVIEMPSVEQANKVRPWMDGRVLRILK